MHVGKYKLEGTGRERVARGEGGGGGEGEGGKRGLEEREEERRRGREEERKRGRRKETTKYYTFCLGQLIGRVAMVTVAMVTVA